MYPILITSVGGGLASHLCNVIKKGVYKDLSVIGVNNRSNIQAENFFDKFEVVPNPSHKGYIKKIIEIIKKYKVRIAIPGSDEEALILSKNKKQIEKNKCTLACVDHRLLQIFNDKIKTYKKLKIKNLPVATFFETKNLKELKNKINYFKNKDFVIKPALSRGGRDILVVKGNLKKIEKKNHGREIHIPKKIFFSKFINKNYFKFPSVIMERLYYPVYDLDMLSFRGEPINVVARKRLNPNEPNEGHVILKNKKIIAIGKKIIKEFNLSWLYDCDLMLDKKGNLKIIEINPRMSGSVAVSVEAGYPIFDNLISLARNKKIRKKEIKKNILIFPYTKLSKVNK